MSISSELRYQIYVKGHGYLTFSKYIGKNMSKNLSDKYSHHSAKKSGVDVLKTASKK